MASGDIIYQAAGYPSDSTRHAFSPSQVSVNIPLYNESSQNISNGSVSLVATVGPTPYGQGWSDPRSPFVPSKQYRVTITEI